MKWLVKKGSGGPRDRKPLCRKNSAEWNKGWDKNRRNSRDGAQWQKAEPCSDPKTDFRFFQRPPKESRRRSGPLFFL
jgi:hypothetical protein